MNSLNNLINSFTQENPNTYSFPGKGFFTACMIKIKHIFSKDDSSLVQEIYDRIFSEQGPQIDASSLRWFSNTQLALLGAKISEAKNKQDNRIQNLFKDSVVVAYQRQHSLEKQSYLAQIYLCLQTKDESAIMSLPQEHLQEQINLTHTETHTEPYQEQQVTVSGETTTTTNTVFSKEDFIKCVKSEGFSSLNDALKKAIKNKNSDLLGQCFTYHCLASGIVKIDDQDLEEIKNSITIKQIDECIKCVKAGTPESVSDETRQIVFNNDGMYKNLMGNLYTGRPLPENYENFTDEEKLKAIAMGRVNKNYSDFPIQLFEMKYENKETEYRKKLVNDLEKMKTDIEESNKNEIERKEKEKTTAAIEAREKELNSFMNTLKVADCKTAKKEVEDFKITSNFPQELWCLANNFPHENIPYNLPVYKKIEDVYSIKAADFTEYVDNIAKSLKNISKLKQFIATTPHRNIYNALHQLEMSLLSLEKKLENIPKNKDLELSGNEFSNIKWKDIELLRTDLLMSLRKAEEEKVLTFMSSLAVLTLNRTQDDDNLVGNGLGKLRDFICERNPRQKDMERGNFGVAAYIFEHCCSLLFHESSQSGVKKYEEKLNDGAPLVPIAKTILKERCHFTCIIRCKEGIYEFDTIGARKTPEKDETDVQNGMSISKRLYDKSEQLSVSKICVAEQDENNCYLSAGWLKFCTFLHFYRQSITS